MGFPRPHGDHPVSVAPLVRLSRIKSQHVRLVEMLRAIKRHGRATANVFGDDVVNEMLRRGALAPEMVMVGGHGNNKLTSVGRDHVRKSVRLAEDLGLIEPAGRTAGLFRLTQDGVETLADWDDPDADGVYAR